MRPTKKAGSTERGPAKKSGAINGGALALFRLWIYFQRTKVS
jgi:hypothetical protein